MPWAAEEASDDSASEGTAVFRPLFLEALCWCHFSSLSALLDGSRQRCTLGLSGMLDYLEKGWYTALLSQKKISSDGLRPGG